jgi:hypothetical protein
MVQQYFSFLHSTLLPYNWHTKVRPYTLVLYILGATKYNQDTIMEMEWSFQKYNKGWKGYFET